VETQSERVRSAYYTNNKTPYRTPTEKLEAKCNDLKGKNVTNSVGAFFDGAYVALNFG
jgi:hypothetical protein